MGTEEHSAIIWSLQDRAQVAIMPGHTDNIELINLSSDSKHIISHSFSDVTLKIWNLQESLEESVIDCSFEKLAKSISNRD